MDLDTGLLRAFVAVSDSRHFGRAADSLFTSQQALSKRIARLEAVLGVKLLERDRRSVSLTAAGEGLLAAARHIVDQVDSVVASTTGVRELTVDILDEHLSVLPAVRAARQLDPELSLEVVSRSDGSSALAGLRSGVADVAFGRPGPVGPEWPDDIGGRPVLAEAIELVVPAGHPLDRADGIRLEELRDQPIWFPTSGAPAEWTELLSELAEAFALRIDERGSTFGYGYWLASIADGTASPSLLGAQMAIPPGLSVARTPLIQPVPVFWWWAMWRRRLPTALVDRLLGPLTRQVQLGPVVTVDAAALERRSVWLPGADRALVPR